MGGSTVDIGSYTQMPRTENIYRQTAELVPAAGYTRLAHCP